jgi:hypothetical protein
MSLYVGIKGIIDADEKYCASLAAWHACKRAGVLPPKELCAQLGIDYDSNQEPNPDGAEVAIKKTGDVMSGNGATVDLRTLPPGVTKLRVYCSG